MISILKCPVCGEILERKERVFLCSNAHSFDLAKEGYLNLVLNAKKTAGDAKEMMTARRNFLAHGYYSPLSDALNATLLDACSKIALPQPSIVDIGCGEGYYLSRFQEKTDQNFDGYGLDISKIGIRMAAKRDKNLQWIVANFAHLPFMDHSISILLSMFAEYSVEEMDRILTQDGAIVIVRAGSNHLIELKNIIYPVIHEKEKSETIKPFFDYDIQRHTLSYQVLITSKEDLMSLLLMTPHYWKIKPSGLAHLKTYDQLTVTVNIEIDLLYRKIHIQ
ncbi:methyltransferase domain-containing protein [Lactococcus hircilactis]|uniref:Methyltransferase domain-containing protein n=1 Tax=Lactococcus hircilactis TaxID=1494462 RepID=A0A7X1Z716_9LACT|nr:methyltransferase domain-containing protein [Lactococcus hircilactis]MQW38787.1 methyltransferase domain-containing protein [Lactococcus hircilactis]